MSTFSFESFIDLFKDADVPGGPNHYAEPFQQNHPLKMPFNAMVNIIYPLVGFFWLFKLLFGNIKHYKFYYVVFILFSITYGPIQFMRIITQSRAWGILDQWITLPFFSLASAWGLAVHKNVVASVQKSNNNNNNNKNLKNKEIPTHQHLFTSVVIFLVSTLSYFLAAFRSDGFDIALGFQILFVLGTSCLVVKDVLQTCSDSKKSTLILSLLVPLVGALISCSAFVGLKLLDFETTEFLFSVFQTRNITGHFVSKIGDAGQIHFILLFFTTVIAHLEHSSGKVKTK